MQGVLLSTTPVKMREENGLMAILMKYFQYCSLQKVCFVRSTYILVFQPNPFS